MPTLRPEVKKKWTDALRSGTYTQGEGQLRDQDDNFCCLGVLCQIAAQEGVIPPAKVMEGWTDYTYGNPTAIDQRTGVLPPSVQEWAFEDYDDSLKAQANYEDPIMGDHHASNWNDDYDADFQKIANLVEAYL